MKPVRTLVTPVVAAALVFAGISAAPARANSNEDIAKFLIGLGAVAIIAKAIDQKSDSDSKATTRNYDRYNNRVVTRSRSDRVVSVPDRKKKKKAKLSRALPASCLRTYSAGRNDRRLYSGRCLSRLPYKLAKLPSDCAYTIKGRRGTIGKAYGPRCLSRNGFYRAETTTKNNRRQDNRHIVYER